MKSSYFPVHFHTEVVLFQCVSSLGSDQSQPLQLDLLWC